MSTSAMYASFVAILELSSIPRPYVLELTGRPLYLGGGRIVTGSLDPRCWIMLNCAAALFV